jgi:metal-responsive CopG/Arc/MetJ family transcriptional regulator
VTQTVRTTVRLPSDLQQQVDSLAAAKGMTGQALIRRAVGDFIQRSDPDAASSKSGDLASSVYRQALVNEFSQATLDLMLRDRPASDRDEVLLTVQQRMEKFHGKK